MALALEHVARHNRRRTLHSSCIESESNRNGIEAIENEKWNETNDGNETKKKTFKQTTPSTMTTTTSIASERKNYRDFSASAVIDILYILTWILAGAAIFLFHLETRISYIIMCGANKSKVVVSLFVIAWLRVWQEQQKWKICNSLSLVRAGLAGWLDSFRAAWEATEKALKDQIHFRASDKYIFMYCIHAIAYSFCARNAGDREGERVTEKWERERISIANRFIHTHTTPYHTKVDPIHDERGKTDGKQHRRRRRRRRRIHMHKCAHHRHRNHWFIYIEYTFHSISTHKCTRHAANTHHALIALMPKVVVATVATLRFGYVIQ